MAGLGIFVGDLRTDTIFSVTCKHLRSYGNGPSKSQQQREMAVANTWMVVCMHAGFDEEEFTSRSGGKAEACKALKQQFGYEVVAMVGDGATDAEARCEGGAEIFVCYGGVVLREPVAAEADWVVMQVQTLINALDD